jgi:hypothetical protein
LISLLVFTALAASQAVADEATAAYADCGTDKPAGTATYRATDQSTDDRTTDGAGHAAEFRIVGSNGRV